MPHQVTQQNGNNFLSYRWLVGILITFLTMSIVAWAASMDNRLAKVEDTTISVAQLQAQSESTNKRLDRIESKLDQVLGIR